MILAPTEQVERSPKPTTLMERWQQSHMTAEGTLRLDRYTIELVGRGSLDRSDIGSGRKAIVVVQTYITPAGLDEARIIVRKGDVLSIRLAHFRNTSGGYRTEDPRTVEKWKFPRGTRAERLTNPQDPQRQSISIKFPRVQSGQ